MTTTDSLPEASLPEGSLPEAESTALPAAPRYSLRLSTDAALIDAARRLRYQVLTDEGRGGAVGIGYDADCFDEHCVHVLVRDNRTGDLIGCTRVLPPGGALAAGDLHIAQSFDMSALEPLRMAMLEFGRAVVRPDHRDGAVGSMMWSAILEYADRYGYDYIVGCLSMPIDQIDGTQESQVRSVRDFVRRNFAAPDCYTVRPYRPVLADALNYGHSAPQRELAPRTIPALMRGYLRLGAKSCGDPAYDAVFGVAQFPTLLNGSGVDNRYLVSSRP